MTMTLAITIAITYNLYFITCSGGPPVAGPAVIRVGAIRFRFLAAPYHYHYHYHYYYDYLLLLLLLVVFVIITISYYCYCSHY